MITLVRVLFWLPSVVLIAIIFYLMHWNKERLYLAVLTLPVIYFMWKVFNYNYFEPDSVFVEELSGLVLSLLIVILYLIRLNKKTLSPIDCLCSFLWSLQLSYYDER